MTDCYRATPRVDYVGIDRPGVNARKGLHGERLVQLDRSDVAPADPRALQPRVVDTRVSFPAGKPIAGLGSTHGARVMDSTPPAITTCASPVATKRDAIIAASRLEPHSLLTVKPGTLTGSPASSAFITVAPRSSGLTAPRAPANLPNGVRTEL